jgi:hypothetical protein
LKIFNFKTTFRDNNSIKSLSELSRRIKSIEKNGNGHDDDHKNQEEKECALYPGIKLPTREFVMSLILDKPDIMTTKDELAKLVLHRVKMRYHFPTKFKSKELARGDLYLLDEYEDTKILS